MKMHELKIKKKKIVVIGAGAAGLELVAHLKRHQSNEPAFELTLVDMKLKHIWKPLFHEVAAGNISPYEDEVDYLAYAHQQGLKFQVGALKAIDRKQQRITLAAYQDDQGHELITQRQLDYDILILALGSLTNDFKTPGVSENCFVLDNLYQAEYFNKTLKNHLLQTIYAQEKKSFTLAIIGGGATGVELAAEIHTLLNKMIPYSFESSGQAYHYKIILIEAAGKILSNLPDRIIHKVVGYLKKLKVEIFTNKKVIQIKPGQIVTGDGDPIQADMIVWAAGVKADPLLTTLDGLATNKINQLLVNQQMQTTLDENIFALGDCAACPQITAKGETFYVPPRAQAAHQQASLLAKSIICYLQAKPLLSYYYKDYGSLIAISQYNVVGTLMGKVAKSLYIEGFIARLAYWYLYKNHQITLWGFWHTFFKTIGNWILAKTKPKFKIH
jgi:NADH:ubiquinone reductase (H+-translocating)